MKKILQKLNKILDDCFLYDILTFRGKNSMYLISAHSVIDAKSIAKDNDIKEGDYRIVPIKPPEIRARVIHDCQPVTEGKLIGGFSEEEREILLRKNTRKDYSLEKDRDRIKLNINGIPIITISEKGVFYKGKLVRDAGELHRRFLEYLTYIEEINKDRRKKVPKIIDTISSKVKRRRKVS